MGYLFRLHQTEGNTMNDVTQNVILPKYLLEPTLKEWLWNKVDEGKLLAKKVYGEYQFYVSKSYIDFKSVLVRDLEESILSLTRFYIRNKI